MRLGIALSNLTTHKNYLYWNQLCKEITLHTHTHTQTESPADSQVLVYEPVGVENRESQPGNKSKQMADLRADLGPKYC